MFNISQSDSYGWPVVVQIPVSGGKFEKNTFDGEFKRLPQSRVKKILEEIENGQIDSDYVLAKEILVGWKGVVDADKNEVPFSAEALEKLLDVPVVAAAIIKAYFESVQGAKVKN